MNINISVVSNDAGATEYIAYLIKNHADINWIVFAMKDSPAAKIFTRLHVIYAVLDDVNSIKSFDKDIAGCSLFIYGTGGQISFNKIVNEICVKNSVKSMAVIDHWTNYKERFPNSILPDYIMVADDKAYSLSKNIFPSDVNIVQVKNYFLEEIKKEYTAKVSKITKSTVVFISEPTMAIAKINFQDENGYGFTEYSVVEDLLKIYDSITIRLHPADEKNKYDEIIKKFEDKDITIIIPEYENLIDTLCRSRLTIGFDGMALYISYILGMDTVSYMPNSDRILAIPIPKEYLTRNLDDLKKITIKPINCSDLQSGANDFLTILDNLIEDKSCIQLQ